MLTALIIVFAMIFFILRYFKRRESLDFLSMVISLLGVVSVVMDTTLTDNERLVLFFIPFTLMCMSALGLLDQKKW